MNRTIGTVITAVTAFAGGVIAGMLITPQNGRENRKWISEHTSEAKHWMEDHGQKILEESEKKLGKISEGIRESLPDLYEATESVFLDESDLEDA